MGGADLCAAESQSRQYVGAGDGVSMREDLCVKRILLGLGAKIFGAPEWATLHAHQTCLGFVEGLMRKRAMR